MSGSLNPALIVEDSFPARVARSLSPGWGWCQRCGWPWGSGAVEHVTQVRDGRGIFPLCESCWERLGAEAKLECYMLLVEQWKTEGAPAPNFLTKADVAAALARELGHKP